jgi:hypothetical protein
MRTFQFALAAALLMALGCRSNNTQVLVEQEARMFEDEVYNLEAQLDECCRAKQGLARENEDLKRRLADGSGASDREPAIETPLRRSTPSRGGAPGFDSPKLEPPVIELPGSSEPPSGSGLPGDEQPAVEGAPAKLSINKRLTGGLDRDSAGGDEGIMVMVEPRDDRGRLVKAPGAVSLVVMDPSQVGDEARVARWDFQAHEFDQHFKKSTFGQGLQYELEWPGEPPKNRELLLYVKYIAEDGSKLIADAPIKVRMADDSPRVVSHTDDGEDREPRSRVTSRSRDPEPRSARGGKPQWSPTR